MSCRAPHRCLTYESTFDFSPLSPFYCHSYLSHSRICIKQLHCNMLTGHTHTYTHTHTHLALATTFPLNGLQKKSCCWAHYYIFRLLITFQLLKQICYIECLISLLNCSRWMWLWLRTASTRHLSIKEKQRDGEDSHALVAPVCCPRCSTLDN